jgi:hypothetical protein
MKGVVYYMINIDYVNGSIDLETTNIFKPYESFMESCKNDINKMFAGFDMLSERVALESAIMDTIPESMVVVYESEKKNVFAKIGEMIVAIYNKFVEVIDKIIDVIKNHSFKKKSDLQKLDILLKKHPDLKDEVIVAFNDGALNLSDARNLKDLDSTFEEILKLAKKKDIDPKSLKGKWEKAKEKIGKVASTTVKVAGGAATVITAVKALKTFNSDCARATNIAHDEKQKRAEQKAEILARLKDEGTIDDNTGIWRTMLEIWREMNNMHAKTHKDNLTFISKISNGISSFLDKFDKDATLGKHYRDNASETKRLKDEREKKIFDDKVKEDAAKHAERTKIDNESRQNHKGGRS